MQETLPKLREYLGKFGLNKPPIWLQIQVATADCIQNDETGQKTTFCWLRFEPNGQWEFAPVPYPAEWYAIADPAKEKEPQLALLIWCHVELDTDL